MEEQLPTTQIPPEQVKKSGKKKLLISLGAIGILLVIIIATFFMLKSVSVKKGTIAPSAEKLGNPLNIQVSLGFSTYNLTAINATPTTVDLNLQTLTSTGISGGKVVLKYDPYTVSDVQVKTITGTTSIVPNAFFSTVKYNPGNVVISFSLPEGSTPVVGSGRFATITFTPTANKQSSKATLSYDLKLSELYTIEGGQQKKLKPSRGDLDVIITP